MSVLKVLSRTKLYWGLIAILLIGVLGSPVSSKGNNIFLSYGNLLDVLRQVSTTGLIATGMTAVIITAGIDLSVGSLMAICSVVCAMLLTVPGYTPAAVIGVPTVALVALFLGVISTRFIFLNLAKARAGAEFIRDIKLDAVRGMITPGIVGVVLCCLALWFLLPQINSKFGVIGVLLVAPCVGLLFGTLNGVIIVVGRLQPFIVTLAMMVTALGVARLTAPGVPGLYELRYVLNADKSTLASLPLEIVEAEMGISGPATVRVGENVDITWPGEINPRDMVVIVPAGADANITAGYIRTDGRSEARMKAPDTAGLYEIRYILNKGGRVLASAPLEVVAADAPLDDGAGLDVPATARPGDVITVSWTGGSDSADQRISLAGADQPDFSWIATHKVGADKTLQLTMPEEAGTYEVRYLDISGRKVLGRAIVEVK